MPTYIIRGWTKDALRLYELAHSLAARGSAYIERNYYAGPENYRFEARGPVAAWKIADKKYPKLTERRELLQVIPKPPK